MGVLLSAILWKALAQTAEQCNLANCDALRSALSGTIRFCHQVNVSGVVQDAFPDPGPWPSKVMQQNLSAAGRAGTPAGNADESWQTSSNMPAVAQLSQIRHLIKVL